MSIIQNTDDMIYVHNVMRQALSGHHRLFTEVAATSPTHRDAVHQYYHSILALIHSHHSAEDALLLPLLIARAQPEEKAQVELGMSQHEDVHRLLAQAQAQLAAWQEQGDPGAQAQLLATLDALALSFGQHSQHEESQVLPLCRRYIEEAEWRQLPGYTLTRLKGNVLMMIIGMVRDAFNDDFRHAMDSNMPPPLKQAWLQDGQPMYRKQKELLAAD